MKTLISRYLLVAAATSFALGCDSQTPGTDELPECGDDVKEGTEECDGADLGEMTCAGLSLGTGDLACNDDCTYDTGDCGSGGDGVCGDDAQGGTEDCDGSDLAGADCTTLGFTGGTLACLSSCDFDAAGCTGGCGNGAQEDLEDCDGDDLAGVTCAALGLTDGTLACAADCSFDTDGCSGSATCGNSTIEFPEDCEGADLSGEDCVSLGYLGGTLTCDAACAFDESGCHSCGDDVMDAGEACDGSDLGGADCAGLGYDGGTLACAAGCTLDESGCTTCGDNDAAGDEECDGGDLNGESCASLGLASGALACDVDCTYDITGCSASATCGNDAVEYPEDCDNAELAGADCTTLGWAGGSLACAGDCSFDETGCLSEVCGNDVIEGGEACDGNALGGLACTDLGFVGGELDCAGDCTLDESGCLAEICGNGAIEGGEACDGLDLGGQGCADLGYTEGTLSCSGDCSFDASGCTTCGDGNVEGTEDCDGVNLDGEDCASLGLTDGTLACTASCGFDVSACSGTATCGNDVQEGLEDCDGSDLGGENCGSLGFDGGTLACDGSCLHDTSACFVCGDGSVDAGEDCDGSDLAGQDCVSRGFAGGSLACALDCSFDESACIPATSPTCTPTPTPANVEEISGPVPITFTCTDADGDQLSLTAQDTTADPGTSVLITNDGPGLTLHAVVTLDPDSDDAGATGTTSFDVSFTVTDEQANDVTVVQNVTYTNPPPTHLPDPVPDQVVTVGEVVTFDVTFTDPDADGLSIAEGTSPGYVTITTTGNVATVLIAPAAAADDSGSPDLVEIDADDGQGGLTTAAFFVEVNQAPVANAGGTLTVAPGELVTLDGTASTDPDGDPLTCLWTAGVGAPALDDPTSCTPSFTAVACNDLYTYSLVVNDGYVDSAADTAQISVEAFGPFVARPPICTPGDECGSIDKPWCTIQAGVDSAVANGLPEVYVHAGSYGENPVIPGGLGGSPDLLGGYTDFATMTRAATASCDLLSVGDGATVITTTNATGVQFTAGNNSLFERFCVRSSAVGGLFARKANATIADASPTLSNNIIDAVSNGLVGITIGIDISAADASALPAPTLELNVDDPAGGIYFAGDGATETYGVYAVGRMDLTVFDNVISAAGAASPTQTAAIAFSGGGSLIAGGNSLAGGNGSNLSRGLSVIATLGNLDLLMSGETISGGTSAADATAVWLQGVNDAAIDTSTLLGRTAPGQRAVGLHGEDIANLTVTTSCTIKGGPVSVVARGIEVTGNSLLLVSDDNEIRGGTAVSSVLNSNAALTGIWMQGGSQLWVELANDISGADVDDAGVPIHGGLTTIGILTMGTSDVVIDGNDSVLGGSPELPAAGPGTGTYFAGGVVLRSAGSLQVSGNGIVQGCAPYCGPGISLSPTQPTAVGVAVEGQGGNGLKQISTNGFVIGGPAIGGGLLPPNDTLAVGVAISGSPDDATAPWVTVENNGVIAGNVEPDAPLGQMRPENVRGILVAHANLTATGNTTIVGGRSFGTAMGVHLVKLSATPTTGTLTSNGEIIGNPYNDNTGAPTSAVGVQFDAGNRPGSSLTVSGLFDALQPIGGGYARPDALSGGSVYGLRASNLDLATVEYNRIWGGIVAGGDAQVGARINDIDQRTNVNANLIEACGYGDAAAGVHDAACENLAAGVNSVGLVLYDSTGLATAAYNNRIFGGFSPTRSVGVVIVDGGDSNGGVDFFNNYVNAQGVLPTTACVLGTGEGAVAVLLTVFASGVIPGTGSRIDITNNIVDAGGRTCTRYGIYEEFSFPVPLDLFTALTVTNNLWVQANADRDLVDANARVWAYREEDGVGGIDWCLAGTDVVGPGACLNGTTAPTDIAGYDSNYQADPAFTGNDVAMSEMPSSLSLADFHTGSIELENRGLPIPQADYETDGRDATSACEIGHDEW